MNVFQGMLEDANPRQWVPHRDDMALMSPFGGFGGGLFGGVMRQMVYYAFLINALVILPLVVSTYCSLI